jgi:hypothetical protein
MKQSAALLCALALGLPGRPAAAAMASFNLDTSRVEATIKAGKTKKVSIKITNPTTSPMRVTAEFQDVSVSTRNGALQFSEPGTTPYSLKGLGMLPPRELLLPARSVRFVRAQLAVPPDARGGYYGAILFASEPVKRRASEIGGPSFKVRIASLILITVKGTEAPAAKISAFTARREGEKIKVRLAVANAGNVLIRPQGRVRLSQAGRAYPILLKEDANARQRAFLPSETAYYAFDWPDKGLPPGRIEAAVDLDFGGGEVIGADAPLE